MSASVLEVVAPAESYCQIFLHNPNWLRDMSEKPKEIL
jgi:hypothetical protein